MQLLESEHDELEARLRKLVEAHDKTRARDLFQDVKDQVDLLERLEEIYLFPPLRADEDARNVAHEGFEEHGLVDRLIQELSAIKPDDPDWYPKVKVLAEILERHIREKRASSLSGEEALTQT